MPEKLRTYVWDDRSNFGDQIGPRLAMDVLKRVAGRDVVLVNASNGPRLFTSGSVLDRMDCGDVAWGTGSHQCHLSLTRGRQFLCVRGPLSRRLVLESGSEVDTLYVDPVEYVAQYWPYLVEKPRERIVIPHLADDTCRKIADRRGWKVVEPDLSPYTIAPLIAGAAVVYTSSLHALVAAEAYGVPAIWFSSGQPRFKYDDWYLGTGRNPEPLQWQDRRVPEDVWDHEPYQRPPEVLDAAARRLAHWYTEVRGNEYLVGAPQGD